MVKHSADVHNTVVKQHNFISASWLYLWGALSKGIVHWAITMKKAESPRGARAVSRISSVWLLLWKERLRWCRCGSNCSLGQTDPSIPLPPQSSLIQTHTCSLSSLSSVLVDPVFLGYIHGEMGLMLEWVSFPRHLWIPLRLWQEVCCWVTAETEWLHVPQNAEGGFQNKVCSEELSYLLYEHA